MHVSNGRATQPNMCKRTLRTVTNAIPPNHSSDLFALWLFLLVAWRIPYRNRRTVSRPSVGFGSELIREARFRPCLAQRLEAGGPERPLSRRRPLASSPDRPTAEKTPACPPIFSNNCP
eukprot:1468490-Prymnesium_polylepis.1